MRNPPLSLYVHIPWCVQKCPYCDFNSHGLKSALPEKEYVAHLLDDLAIDAKAVGDRPVDTVFIGGGTPSLFSAQAMADIIEGIKSRVNLACDAEITMEANPGTVEAGKFEGFYQAGVNRISVGIQSFQPQHLSILGRIHSESQAVNAVAQAHSAGLPTFNLDLMHGLPQQSVDNAMSDLNRGIDLNPYHLSWYQLTIEPNTPFYSRPPELPDDDILWEIQEQGHRVLEAAGYKQYEISAYSKEGHQCRHNLNYWRFGDYLGIGCGAHGKITDVDTGSIQRLVKVKHPRGYMEMSRPYIDKKNTVEAGDLPFEFFMNRFRLLEPCPIDDYRALTGLDISDEVKFALEDAAQKGLLDISSQHWQVTSMGRRYLNTLLSCFV
ncbi:YggW family oxidoreductase [Alteromonas sp. MB-3u-76]|uniref:radical SAM family heme chaperone HemW n=1 Tax=unclassified Alteromonas TaxID=2614992 RepID=UPI000903CFD4|nr:MULTISPECIES: radical SAM family heme chaperone HemW [unclassified Alteromonas]APE05051.1 YggW family oxidoreductase [Alteromonas sp. RW2A1]AUC87524.1 YggW family oxidoreductase [Alteromonas sp. MB-3u-76]